VSLEENARGGNQVDTSTWETSRTRYQNWKEKYSEQMDGDLGPTLLPEEHGRNKTGTKTVDVATDTISKVSCCEQYQGPVAAHPHHVGGRPARESNQHD